MKLFSEKDQCCGCMACADICPQNAIQVRPDSEGFLYPELLQERCITCDRCQAVCPMTAERSKIRRRRYFAAQANDQTMRVAGASGGVFPVLADYVLEHGGVVYGAAFDDSMRVIHQRVASRDALSRLVRSKYIQSETAGIFRCIQKDLQMGLQTLFVGTPCQVEALRRFLAQDDPNLILVDLICYGVPSPEVWASYTAYLEKKHRGRLTEFQFRDKKRCDNGQSVCYGIDGTKYFEKNSANLFLSMYFSNYMLRPSCHVCPFTTVERSSDLTIGDFWRVEERLPQLDDGMGTSSVILHSEAGNRLWDCVQDQFKCVECSAEQIVQPRLLEPTPQSPKRRLFFALYRRLPFSLLMGLLRIRRKANGLRHFVKRMAEHPQKRER